MWFLLQTLARNISVSEEDLDYLTNFNLSICGIIDDVVINSANITMFNHSEPEELCSLGQLKVGSFTFQHRLEEA